MYITTNGFYLGVLCISEEAQRVVLLSIQLLLVVFDLAYSIPSEFAGYVVISDCTAVL